MRLRACRWRSNQHENPLNLPITGIEPAARAKASVLSSLPREVTLSPSWKIPTRLSGRLAVKSQRWIGNGAPRPVACPQVDHLFDRGFMSFSDDGRVLVSPRIRDETLAAWGIDLTRNVGSFNTEQKV